MRAIGGFFELEVQDKGTLYHANSIGLSTGRACLRLIIELLKPKLIYVPFYSCDALYEPLIEAQIPMRFYAINESLEIADYPNLETDEYLIACDFFGIKEEYVNRVITKYGVNVIVDNTHNFFHKGYQANCSFTSARKYFGVPDGAFAYLGKHTYVNQLPRNKTFSATHNILRLIGCQEEAYEAYLDYEESLTCDLKAISVLSERLLKQVDDSYVKLKRKENFRYLAEALDTYNLLKQDTVNNPFCYPFLPKTSVNRKELYAQKLFIPTFWQDTLERSVSFSKFKWERYLSKELLPLPIDHRYGKEDMSRIIEFLVGYL